MTPFQNVVRNELVEIALDLLGALEPGGAPRHAETFVGHGPVLPLHEAVGAGRTNLGGAMLDSFHRGQQFVGMDFRTSAELASVVGEDRPDRNAQCLVERKNPIIEQIARCDRHLRVVEFGERDRAEYVHDDLDINLADTFQGSPPGCLHVLARNSGL